jgi:putative pyruvate formate lyase activating enzyme
LEATKTWQPPYIPLHHSGELEKRTEELNSHLADCDICPRQWSVNRLENEAGFCNSGRRPIVASFCAHHGEEPVLSGRRGSGTIFLGNCNLRCLYCQNYQISQNPQRQRSNETDGRTLAERMLYLQEELCCHNINFVSPSHFAPQIVAAIALAVPMGLNVPLVYNSNGYDSVETLKALDGIMSIYLPDLKYAEDRWARKFSQAPEYVRLSRAAITEMFRQVGFLELDDDGVARRGLIVRHLVLPNGLAGSAESLAWLAGEVSPRVAVSLMSQYYPRHRAPRVPLLAQPVSAEEYGEALKGMETAGLAEGWCQGKGAEKIYLPNFERNGGPFDQP